MFNELHERFIRYAQIDTRSDESSTAVPSTQSQVEFAHLLVEELQELGLSEVEYDDRSGFVTATLPANVEKDLPVIGFIAHMDTADFPS